MYPSLEGRYAATPLWYRFLPRINGSGHQAGQRWLAADELGAHEYGQRSDHGWPCEGFAQRPMRDRDGTDGNEIMIGAYSRGRQGL